MNKEEVIKLISWAYQEGYRSAMAVIKHIIEDRTQDEIFKKMIEDKIKELPAFKNK